MLYISQQINKAYKHRELSDNHVTKFSTFESDISRLKLASEIWEHQVASSYSQVTYKSDLLTDSGLGYVNC